MPTLQEIGHKLTGEDASRRARIEAARRELTAEVGKTDAWLLGFFSGRSPELRAARNKLLEVMYLRGGYSLEVSDPLVSIPDLLLPPSEKAINRTYFPFIIREKGRQTGRTRHSHSLRFSLGITMRFPHGNLGPDRYDRASLRAITLGIMDTRADEYQSIEYDRDFPQLHAYRIASQDLPDSRPGPVQLFFAQSLVARTNSLIEHLTVGMSHEDTQTLLGEILTFWTSAYSPGIMDRTFSTMLQHS